MSHSYFPPEDLTAPVIKQQRRLRLSLCGTSTAELLGLRVLKTPFIASDWIVFSLVLRTCICFSSDVLRSTVVDDKIVHYESED